MDFYPTEIHNLAKKHKKLFEKYFINPGGCLINGHEFYWVNYFKFGKLHEHAVISPNNVTDINEYKQAFIHLSKSSQLRANLTSKGGFRANIHMGSFIGMKNFLDTILEEVDLKDDREVVVNCQKAMQQALTLQDKLVKVYTSYHEKEKEFHEGTMRFDTDEYLEFVLDCTGEIDYIQYTQLKIQYDATVYFELLKKIANSNDSIKKHMNYEVKTYLKEFIKGKNDLQKGIRKITSSPEITNKITKERHIEIGRKKLLKSVEDVTLQALKDLRFPKLKDYINSIS